MAKRKPKGTYYLKDCRCLVTDTVHEKMCDKHQKEYDEIRKRWIHEHNNPLILESKEFNK